MEGQDESHRRRAKAWWSSRSSLWHTSCSWWGQWGKPPGLGAVRQTSEEMRGAYARRP
jgi:hypothetical protein